MAYAFEAGGLTNIVQDPDRNHSAVVLTTPNTKAEIVGRCKICNINGIIQQLCFFSVSQTYTFIIKVPTYCD